MSKLVSVNIAKPIEVAHQGRHFRTSINKQPTSGRVVLGKTRLAGDQQADTTNHGGINKGVYFYPSEHYQYWQEYLTKELPYGCIGENLTTAGLFEHDVCIGDRLAIADTLVEVTQPRIPCYKLDINIGLNQFSKIFAQSCKLGFYAKVIKPGSLAAGDDITSIHCNPNRITIHEVARLYFVDLQDYSAIERVLDLKILPHNIRKVFESRLLVASKDLFVEQ